MKKRTLRITPDPFPRDGYTTFLCQSHEHHWLGIVTNITGKWVFASNGKIQSGTLAECFRHAEETAYQQAL